MVTEESMLAESAHCYKIGLPRLGKLFKEVAYTLRVTKFAWEAAERRVAKLEIELDRRAEAATP